MTILPEGPTTHSIRMISGLTPTLKLTGILTLNKKATSLSFNACPVQPCRGRPGGQKRPNGFFGLILLILLDLSNWPVALAIAMSHYIIDGLKLSFQTEKNRSYWFAADQLAHLAVLFTVWLYYWNETPFYTISDEFWVILTGTIFLTHPSS